MTITRDRFVLLASLLLLLLVPGPALSDIVVTIDGMIFNGKIIENIRVSHVKIANYHGIFTINYDNIRELHRTGNYREDVKIFQKMGQTIDETEVRTNYQAGAEKLENKKLLDRDHIQTSNRYLLFVSPFVNFNIGTLGDILPYGYGAFVLGDIRFEIKRKMLFIGPRLDFQYFHSEMDIKSIAAFRFAAGPAFIIPVEVKKFSFNVTFSPELGTGYYGVTGRYDRDADFKFNFFLSAGLEFMISSWVIAPMIRFDYIHDGEAPLMGIGISLGAGFLFNDGKSSRKQLEQGG